MLHYSPYTDELFDKLEPKAICIGIEESEEEINTAFTNGIQFAWDSTSINLYKTCARKYYWTIVKGYVPKTMPPALAFGIHLHTLLQTWHQLVESGMDKHTSFMRVTRLAGLLGETLPPGDTARTKETFSRFFDP